VLTVSQVQLLKDSGKEEVEALREQLRLLKEENSNLFFQEAEKLLVLLRGGGKPVEELATFFDVVGEGKAKMTVKIEELIKLR
jgi:hypothetical protein